MHTSNTQSFIIPGASTPAREWPSWIATFDHNEFAADCEQALTDTTHQTSYARRVSSAKWTYSAQPFFRPLSFEPYSKTSLTSGVTRWVSGPATSVAKHNPELGSYSYGAMSYFFRGNVSAGDQMTIIVVINGYDAAADNTLAIFGRMGVMRDWTTLSNHHALYTHMQQMPELAQRSLFDSIIVHNDDEALQRENEGYQAWMDYNAPCALLRLGH